MAMCIQKFISTKLIISVVLASAFGVGLYGCSSHVASNAVLGANAVVPGNGVAIYIAGDIADCRKFKPPESGAAKTASLITAGLNKDRDAVVLSLGDNTYPNGLLSEFTDCYEPTWGQFKERTYPTAGNHEYYTPAAVGYYDYFGKAAGPSRRGYYSFNLGKWHIVSLNSNLKSSELNQRQLEWLKEDLAQHPSRCTLTYWHHPLYSSGGHGNSDRMKEVWRVLQSANVEVALVGHDHGYERFSPQDAEGRHDAKHGIREFVVGTGGAKLTPFVTRQPNSEVRDNSTYGVLRMVLKDTGYEWEFLPVTGGNFTDRGAALCH